MTITDDIRVQVIKEYEEEKFIETMKSRVKHRPLGRATRYFNNLIRHSGTLQHGWLNEANSNVRKQICEKYGLKKITDLDYLYYDEANECAMRLFEKEIEKVNHWIFREGTTLGSSAKPEKQKHFTWDEWKIYCRQCTYKV